jgi:hypothetical protein
MIANMRDRIGTQGMNPIPEFAGKQKKLIHVTKPLTQTVGAWMKPAEHGQRIQVLGLNSIIRQLACQQIAETAHALLAVVRIIADQ